MIQPLSVATDGLIGGTSLRMATRGYIAILLIAVTEDIYGKGRREYWDHKEREIAIARDDREIVELLAVIIQSGVLE